MNKTVGLLAVLMAYAASPATAQPTAPGPQDCAALRSLQLPGVALSEVGGVDSGGSGAQSGRAATLSPECSSKSRGFAQG